MTQPKKDENRAFDAGVDDATAKTHATPPPAPAKPQPTATANTGTAPPATPAKPGTPLAAGGHVDKLRTLGAALERGDAVAAKAEIKVMVDELFTSWSPDPAPLMRGAIKSDDPYGAAMRAHAKRVEEVCQHAEGGTNHPVSRAAAVGDTAWLQVILPLLMQILADLLARQRVTT